MHINIEGAMEPLIFLYKYIGRRIYMWKTPFVEIIDFSSFTTFSDSSNAVGCDHMTCC